MCNKNVTECITRCNQQGKCTEGVNRIAWQQKAIDAEKQIQLKIWAPTEVLLTLDKIYEC